MSNPTSENFNFLSEHDPIFIELASSAERALLHTYKVLKNQVHGATRPRINLKQLKGYEVNLPPIEIQSQILKDIKYKLKMLHNVTLRLEAGMNFVKEFTAPLLSKAFRGELVPQDPTDEPASVLLGIINESKLLSKSNIKRKLS